jgi:hypothetical protein
MKNLGFLLVGEPHAKEHLTTEATEVAEKSGSILLRGLCGLCGGSFLRGLRW